MGTARTGARSSETGIAAFVPAGRDTEPRAMPRGRAAAFFHGPELDAQARARARDLAHRFSAGRAEDRLAFCGAPTGGLNPLPAAVSVLILCFHRQHFRLGRGLALTLVVGARSMSLVCRKRKLVDAFFAKAPRNFAVTIADIGVFMLTNGISHAMAQPTWHTVREAAAFWMKAELHAEPADTARDQGASRMPAEK